jgi:hypothetical protein
MSTFTRGRKLKRDVTPSTKFAHECFAELIVVRNFGLNLSDVRGLAGAGSWLGHTFRAPVVTLH